MKEIPVGEFFTAGKDTYKVVSRTGSEDCGSCDLYYNVETCNNVFCWYGDRSDNRSVQFILYDTIED